MHYKLVDEKPKTFIHAFETNDELARGLKGFRIRTEACFGKLQSYWCSFIREARMAQLGNQTIRTVHFEHLPTGWQSVL